MKKQCDYYARRHYTGIRFYGEPDGLIKRVCETTSPEAWTIALNEARRYYKREIISHNGNESSWRAAGGGQSLALGKPTIPSMSLYL